MREMKLVARTANEVAVPGSVDCFDTTIETLLEFGYTP